MAIPVLVVAAVTGEDVYLAFTVAIQTETGCNIDQALTLAIPVLVVTAITAQGIYIRTITVQTMTS